MYSIFNQQKKAESADLATRNDVLILISRYGLGIAATGAALLLRWTVGPYLGRLGTFSTLYPAVAFAAYFLGTGPAVVCTLIGLLAGNYWFLESRRLFSTSPEDLALSVTFLIAATLLVILGRSSRRNLSDLRLSEAKLSEAYGVLENKVEERTQQLAASLASLESEMRVRQKAEARLQELSARVLRLQDEERRHIARELHDGVGQTMSALKMTLASFETLVKGNPKAVDLLCDLKTLADQGVQEIRTTSYLLHPPLLEQLGFSVAAKWYVEGFSKRSGIEAKLELSSLRLNQEAELIFFRVLQESLTNVLRHSGSKTVGVQFESQHDAAVLSIRDHGTGVPPEQLRQFNEAARGGGVGWAGMRERLGQVGGDLIVESDSSGTCITAVLPLANAIQPASEGDQASAT